MKFFLLTLCSFLVSSFAFAPSPMTSRQSATALQAENSDDLLRWARQSRQANSDDNLVELMRPLGLVLNQDENNNVYVETVAPKGNAARTGQVRYELGVRFYYFKKDVMSYAF